MTTGILSKTIIEPTWNTAQVQEGAVAALFTNYTAMGKVIERFGPEAQKEFHRNVAELKANHIKKHNAKTPVEVVKAMAEFETNTFGSKIEIWGDDKSASMRYISCAFAKLAEKTGCMTAVDKQKMGECMQMQIEFLGAEFGFKGGFSFENDTAILTFSR